MGSFGDYLENKVLDHVTGNSSYSAPTVYVAASTADPTDDGSGAAEPSGNSYARVATSAATWGDAASGSITTVTDIEFPEATGSWGTITHIALYDASTNGNMLAHGALAASQAVSSGEVLRITAGNLTLTLS